MALFIIVLKELYVSVLVIHDLWRSSNTRLMLMESKFPKARVGAAVLEPFAKKFDAAIFKDIESFLV
jgi:hypothetical protein